MLVVVVRSQGHQSLSGYHSRRAAVAEETASGNHSLGG